ncbi:MULTISPECIES: rod shape-determining protein MreD [Paenibacillus]|uniref:Rod shape-determining protein MreD n=1 Tax=Paenibacillus tundrae TaxID=528187 RepID=A0ABT9WLH4_9BACL|nr:rod shape-determining protein MreD [Paenibacillus tundrae]MCG7380105.1 rod shape-determining protein MreD [Paenibacillus sp. ACRSA]MDQ0173944.1 rod shape-determining protein MreD [Paenibacillus tundrae]
MVTRKQVLILLLFVLFIAEGTILPLLIPEAWQMRISANLVYIVILFFAVYHHRHTALVLGILFGLLHDVVFYGEMIGPYGFSMGLSAYMIGLIFQAPRAPLPIMVTVVFLGSLLNDTVLFFLYKLFRLNHVTFDWALFEYMIPNLFIHFVFTLIIYVPLRKQLEQITKRQKKPQEAS